MDGLLAGVSAIAREVFGERFLAANRVANLDPGLKQAPLAPSQVPSRDVSLPEPGGDNVVESSPE